MLQAIQKMMREIDSRADGHVYGAWLYGSVVLNDFQQGWSDIDFVALIDGPISDSQAEKLLMLRQYLHSRQLQIRLQLTNRLSKSNF
jgi:predicted nucleotidyltransferase